MQYLTEKYNDVTVYYQDGQNGGGNTFGTGFVDILADKIGRKFYNCFEWCSGPAFIGFNLLSHDHCQNLYMGDYYLPSLKSCEMTIQNLPTRFDDRTFLTLDIKDGKMENIEVPDGVLFDLVVGNPPHWSGTCFSTERLPENDFRICCDLDWQVHRNFFENIKPYLADDGVIVLVEHGWSSNVQDFEGMVHENGFKITNAWENPKDREYWFMVIEKDI